VDNLPSAKNQRLLVEPLYSSQPIKQPFLADANVGVFYAPNRPAIVPDMFLSLNVEIAADWWAKEHRSYFIWEFGKPPDVVVEIVSNKAGQETGTKLRDYAQMNVPYYVVYDPQLLIQKKVLQVYELSQGEYRLRSDNRLPDVGLSLTLWNGVFEGKRDRWLRWCDRNGNLIPTGAERALQEHKRAEQERKRAEQEHKRAEQERLRAERLAAQLRALGIDPESS
jgi:Uma2 family endonuclease